MAPWADVSAQPICKVGKLTAGGGSTELIDGSEAASAALIVLIDSNLMRRQCFEYVLSRSLAGYNVRSVPRISDVPEEQLDLILINIESADKHNGVLHQRVIEIRAKFGPVFIVATSEIDDIAVAIPAIRTALGAIRLVRRGGACVPSELIELWTGTTQASAPELLSPVIEVNGAALASGGAPSCGARGDDTSPSHAAEGSEFTQRESQILDKLRLGRPNKIIAYELNISESTVKVHIRNMMRKLNATNRTQVAFMARKQGGPTGGSHMLNAT